MSGRGGKTHILPECTTGARKRRPSLHRHIMQWEHHFRSPPPPLAAALVVRAKKENMSSPLKGRRGDNRRGRGIRHARSFNQQRKLKSQKGIGEYPACWWIQKKNLLCSSSPFSSSFIPGASSSLSRACQPRRSQNLFLFFVFFFLLLLLHKWPDKSRALALSTPLLTSSRRWRGGRPTAEEEERRGVASIMRGEEGGKNSKKEVFPILGW